MSTAQQIMWLVTFAAGISFLIGKNPTAGALVLAKLAGWAIYRITGDNLPVEYYLYPDIFVLAIIFAKPEICNFAPYQSTWHQLKCILLERSYADRVVMLIFPLMWALYVADLHAYYKWWALYYLVIVQFLAAGWESFANLRAARRKASASTPIIDRHLVVIPFQRRDADAVRKTPSGALLMANGGGSGG